MIDKKLHLLALVFFVHSCSFVSFSDAIPLFKSAILEPPKVVITKEEFEARSFSFIIAQFEDGPGAIMTLSNVAENGVLEWVSADNQLIYTRNGKVISTYGLLHDFQYLNWSGSSWETEEQYPLKRLVSLKNPDAVVEHDVFLESLPAENIYVQFEEIAITSLLKETVKIELLNWQAENYYWLDEKGLVKKTIQTLNPKMKPLTIEFFYIWK